MDYRHSFDPEFDALLEKLRRDYPAELFRIEGIAPDQLDIHNMSRAFFRTENVRSAAADHSVDANANVSGRDTITFTYEVPKPTLRLNSLYNLWKTLRETEGKEAADFAIKSEVSGLIYINDSWDMGRPYCFNYSLYDIALEGLKMDGNLTIDPPRSLFVFLRQVEQFTVYAANSTLGATGLADLLIVASRYVDAILETGRDGHIAVADVETYVREHLTSLIYTLNWKFRGNQSPFTNVSVYDRPFLEQLVPSYVIDGKSPRLDTVELVQDIFLDCFNEVLGRVPVTFPVVTACFSLKPGDGRELADEAFVKNIARHNLRYGFINIYVGETSTLSSCCRLRSNAADLGYANSFGAGSTKIGSLGVVTLNLPWLARAANRRRAEAGKAEAHGLFLGLLDDSVRLAGQINNAKRVFLRDRIRRGSLPLYSLGYMDLARQFSTCGFTGLYEALYILGYDLREEDGLAAAERILGHINETNAELSRLYGAPHNMEQVPAETSAVKLSAKDSAQGRNPEGWPLYSNQFLPLWAEGVDLLDRIRVQGRLDGYCTGGAICHLNISERLSDPAVMEALIRHAAAEGVVYFAINYVLNRCVAGHMSVGHDLDACPVCGLPITDTFTRVVGFLTNTKHWNATRREHDWPERKFSNPKPVTHKESA